ncbi:MAG: hypothetical protein LDL33_09770, partial [Desulfomonile sp.]|nr:hypothetical protein [Desulfomonile sp.]
MFRSGEFRIASWLWIGLVVLICTGCLSMGRQLLGRLEPTSDKSLAEESSAKSSEPEAAKPSPTEETVPETSGETSLTKPRIPDSDTEPARSKSPAELAEKPPQPPSEAKQAQPPKKYKNAREAAIETARNTPGITTIVLCPFGYDGWQVIMWGDDEPKPTRREFVWNTAQSTLESTMTLPTTQEELESERRKYRLMESCEILAYPRSKAVDEEHGRPPDRGITRSEPRKAELVKPSVPESRIEPTPEARIRDREGPRIEPADIPSDAGEKQAVTDFLSRWKSAWESKDLDAYGGFYHSSFRSGRMVYDQFIDHKKKMFDKYRTISVDLDRVS